MYEVTLCVSKASLPASFCTHSFILTTDGDTVNRWEVLDPRVTESHTSNYCGRIFKNFTASTVGLPVLPIPLTWKSALNWRVQKITTLCGGENSVAAQLYHFIEHEDGLRQYPHVHTYNMLLGPNSNTFVQWFIEQFPEANWKLPWNAWGKSYTKK